MSPLRSPILVCAGVLFAFYWISVLFLDTRTIIEFLDGMLISYLVAAMFYYGARVRDALTDERPFTFDIVLLAVAGFAGFSAAAHLWRGWARVTDREELLDHSMLGFLLLGMTFFALLHLSVKDAGEHVEGVAGARGIAPGAASLIAVASVFGVALGFLLIAIDRGVFH